VYQILTNHPELQLSVRTLYRYIETGVFKKFGVDNFSLKEQVSRKQFKEKYKKRKEPANYTGRRYADYLEFIQQNPATCIRPPCLLNRTHIVGQTFLVCRS
jgi:hypothetical protein